MGSTWKNRLSLSIFGQSHGAAIGVTLDGLPAGEQIDMDALAAFLKRRAPGRFPWSTSRQEADEPEFLSGILNGKTCGAPLTAVIRNKNVRPADYAEIKDIPRPGHADYTAHVKYGGFADISGGGHFSGRLTAPLCIAGAVCLQILKRRGICIGAHIAQVGAIKDKLFDAVNVDEATLKGLWEMDIPVLDTEVALLIIEEIERAKQNSDSVGGVIECAAIGLDSGLGGPLFFGMENSIAALVFSIPAVKGIEFGAGFEAASMLGSEHNDSFYLSEEKVKTRTNHHGGILGGITSGMPLVFRGAVKPTPSIGITQESIHLSKAEPASLAVRGRHDPCIVPRAVPCMEAALAIAICDALLYK
ncbi:MAG: chorismate synthase [Treponema sp.]|nr:chorismate synthase [Treponema sp.]